MTEKLLYVEVSSDEAIDLAEDIVYLQEARLLLKKVRHIDAERLFPVMDKVYELERETRYFMRHKYLNGPAKPVSTALRKRLKDNLLKEIPLHGYKISAGTAGKNEPDNENDRSDRKGPEKH